MFSTLFLSRIQFGFTIGFHIIFPTLNIGLAVFLCIMEGMWLKTKKIEYLRICKFWTKIFALTFGMGIVSGVVLSYELGTNFGGFTKAVGEVLGPLFAYEVMSAFFLEAGFLGVMLFGWKKVPPKTHYIATLLVTIGTIISAFWIMSANSWMQTPSGYFMEGSKFAVQTWSDVIFNPSFIDRFLHMLLASLLTASFVIAGVASWFLLKKRFQEIAKPCLFVAILLAAVASPLQLFIGDRVGLIIHHYQPIKTAAIEANWNTTQGAPFIIFGIPDVNQGKNLFTLSIPYAASLINTHSLHGTLIGLNSVAKQDRPFVPIPFFAFRIMLAIGMLFILVSWIGIWLYFRKKLYTSTWFLRLCVFLSPLGFIAAIAGWLTAESGRQPWVVYGLLKTKDAASEVVMQHVLISLILFIIGYGIIFNFYLYYLFKTIRKGPADLDEPPLTISYMPQPKDDEFNNE